MRPHPSQILILIAGLSFVSQIILAITNTGPGWLIALASFPTLMILMLLWSSTSRELKRAQAFSALVI